MPIPRWCSLTHWVSAHMPGLLSEPPKAGRRVNSGWAPFCQSMLRMSTGYRSLIFNSVLKDNWLQHVAFLKLCCPHEENSRKENDGCEGSLMSVDIGLCVVQCNGRQLGQLYGYSVWLTKSFINTMEELNVIHMTNDAVVDLHWATCRVPPFNSVGIVTLPTTFPSIFFKFSFYRGGSGSVRW